MRAHQIMTRPVITIIPGTTIVEAANTMLRKHVSGLSVVDAASKLVGIVSEGDFIRRGEIGIQRKRGRWLRLILGPGKSATDFVHEHGRKVAEIMTKEPLTIIEDTTLEEIVQLRENNNVRRLPVTRGDRIVHLSGVITEERSRSAARRGRVLRICEYRSFAVQQNCRANFSHPTPPF
jgi:CBS domain-containing protein